MRCDIAVVVQCSKIPYIGTTTALHSHIEIGKWKVEISDPVVLHVLVRPPYKAVSHNEHRSTSVSLLLAACIGVVIDKFSVLACTVATLVAFTVVILVTTVTFMPSVVVVTIMPIGVVLVGCSGAAVAVTVFSSTAALGISTIAIPIVALSMAAVLLVLMSVVASTVVLVIMLTVCSVASLILPLIVFSIVSLIAHSVGFCFRSVASFVHADAVVATLVASIGR